jgi:hypothetical protein
VTRWGFRSLAALVLAFALLGGWLVARGAVAKGPPPAPVELSCAQWLAHPRTGHFRLTGCTLDVAHSRAVPSDGYLPPALVEVAREGNGPRLFAATDDPAVVARVERLAGDLDGEQRGRSLERYADELRIEGSVEGRITRGADDEYSDRARSLERRWVEDRDYVLRPLEDDSMDPAREPFPVALGIALIALFAPLFLLLVWAQRSWVARAARLGAAPDGSRRPRVF